MRRRNQGPVDRKGEEERTMTVQADKKRLNFFERYLSIWVVACMVLGIALGKLWPGLVDHLRGMEFGKDSQINVPIAVLIWFMIYPMMLKIDFSSVLGVRKRPKGLLVTLFVNWLVKPFSMAFFLKRQNSVGLRFWGISSDSEARGFGRPQ